MNWVKANDHCKGVGGKLVEIETEEENTALVEEIKKKGIKDKNFWMGLTDRTSEGDWIFETTSLEPSYKNWDDGEPNDPDDGQHDEDCAQIWNKERLTWSDVPCDKDDTSLWNNTEYRSFHALCEFPDSGGTSSSILPQSQLFTNILPYMIMKI